MSFFDRINPFKKKDDLGLPPLDSGPALTQDPLTTARQPLPATPPGAGYPNVQPTTPGIIGAPHLEPREAAGLDDHRMKMPLGDSIRQGRIKAMEGGDYQPIEHHNPPYWRWF